MTTIAWSPRVGQIWHRTDRDGSVEIIGDHHRAGLVQLREVNSLAAPAWIPYDAFSAFYAPACCEACGAVLTGEHLRQLVVDPNAPLN